MREKERGREGKKREGVDTTPPPFANSLIRPCPHPPNPIPLIS